MMFSAKLEEHAGDLFVTATETCARIKYVDGGEVVMRPDTQLSLANDALFSKDERANL